MITVANYYHGNRGFVIMVTTWYYCYGNHGHRIVNMVTYLLRYHGYNGCHGYHSHHCYHHGNQSYISNSTWWCYVQLTADEVSV